MDVREQQIEDIFSAALKESDQGTRQAYIVNACGSDLEMRSRVEELLEAHSHAGDFLEPLIVEPDETVETSRAEPAPGKTVGNYKLLERIGEGGFGVVYRAEQSKPVRRQVALKIIKMGMDTRRVIARFEAERQALALMDHANIAKVLDAGATEFGRPYFVMELVKGIPITDYCNHNRLTVRQRLELFQQVCDAVQHAHQKGIIHRDLKPSNVLVTLKDNVPVPKIIDFGIAKATRERLTDKTLFTGFREFIGTPEYMSPEQASASGIDVDTRTDIYSLGVLLYELLAGRGPFDSRSLRSAGYDEIQRTILEVDPLKPSARVTLLGDELSKIALRRRTEPAALRRLLRGDLDWIVMKAIEKDRVRRYQGAGELAADVERHLHHEPVEASPPSYAYKVSKFIRRNRVAVLAVTLVVAAVVSGASLATVGFLQATRARDALKIERDAAKTARNEAEDASNRESKQRQLAEASAGQAHAEALKAAAVNEFLQSMLASVDPSRALGREVSVRYVLDEAADEIVGGALAAQPEVEATVRMTLGGTYEALGDYEDAERQIRAAVDIRQSELGERHPETLSAQSALAGLLNSQGNYAEAETLAHHTLELQKEVFDEQHPETLITASRLGVALSHQDMFEEAETIHRRTLERQRSILGDEHIDTLRSQIYLGVVMLQRGELAQAEQLLRRSVEVARRVLGQEHPETVMAMNHLALSQERQGKYERAEALYRQCWELDRRVLGPDHPRTQIPLNNLLRVLDVQGKIEEKRPLVMDRLSRLKDAAERPDADARALHAYAWELVTCVPEDLRDPAAALPYARRAVQLNGGKDADLLDTLALVYQRVGDLDSAITTQQRAVKIARAGGPYNVEELESRLSEFLLEKGDIFGAMGAALGGVTTQISETLIHETTGLGGGRDLVSRARVLMSEGDYVNAEHLLNFCLSERRKEYGEGHWLVAETKSLLGEAAAAQEKYEESEPLLLEGYTEMRDNPRVPTERKREALRRIIELYDSWELPEKAREWRRQWVEPKPRASGR